jgi:hypothetical protein
MVNEFFNSIKFKYELYEIHDQTYFIYKYDQCKLMEEYSDGKL